MKLVDGLKSLFFLILAQIITFRQSKRGVVIGTNYGGLPDSNALALIECINSSEYAERVVFISNDISVSGKAEFEKRGGLSSAIAFLNCEAAFYTHSLSDLIPGAHKLPFLRYFIKLPTLIFIQHGMIGLKSVLGNNVSMSTYLNTIKMSFDKMCVSSEQEFDAVVRLGVEPDKLALTGLPRFDYYLPKKDTNKCILVAFTWQEKSVLQTKVEEIKSVPRINQLIGQGLDFVVTNHPMNAASEGINDSKDITKFVSRCALLITDESSIAWDVIYNGGEVLFYKPLTPWLFDDAGLQARRSENIEQLNELVASYMEETLPKIASKFFKHKDQLNSKRTLELGLLKSGFKVTASVK